MESPSGVLFGLAAPLLFIVAGGLRVAYKLKQLPVVRLQPPESVKTDQRDRAADRELEWYPEFHGQPEAGEG